MSYCIKFEAKHNGKNDINKLIKDINKNDATPPISEYITIKDTSRLYFADTVTQLCDLYVVISRSENDDEFVIYLISDDIDYLKVINKSVHLLKTKYKKFKFKFSNDNNICINPPEFIKSQKEFQIHGRIHTDSLWNKGIKYLYLILAIIVICKIFEAILSLSLSTSVQNYKTIVLFWKEQWFLAINVITTIVTIIMFVKSRFTKEKIEFQYFDSKKVLKKKMISSTTQPELKEPK